MALCYLLYLKSTGIYGNSSWVKVVYNIFYEGNIQSKSSKMCQIHLFGDTNLRITSKPNWRLTAPNRRFRPVAIVQNNINLPEQGNPRGQPRVGFWSGPLINMSEYIQQCCPTQKEKHAHRCWLDGSLVNSVCCMLMTTDGLVQILCHSAVASSILSSKRRRKGTIARESTSHRIIMMKNETDWFASHNK